MKRFIIYFLIIFYSLAMYSQSIEGYVIDSLTNKPLKDAFVYIVEVNSGTMTDTNGYFKFTQLPRALLHLQVSYVGYETKILKLIPTNNKKLNIKLEPTAIETNEVIVSAGISASAHTNSVKIETLPIKPFQLMNNSFGEILQSFAGVDVIKKSGAVQMPVIRGLYASNILVLIDGFRLEDFQFSVNHPFFIDELDLKKIEVIKGPASLLYGSDAVGGLINVVPQTYIPAGKTTFDYSIAYNTNTQGINNFIILKNGFKNFSFGISMGVKTHKDYRDAVNQQVINTRYNQNFIKSFLNFNYKNGITKIFYNYTKAKLGLCIPPAVRVVNNDIRKNQMFYQDLEHHLFYFKNTFFLNKWKFFLNGSYEHNNRILIANDSFAAVNMHLDNINYEAKFNYQTDKFLSYLGVQGNWSKNQNKAAHTKFIPDYQMISTSFFSFAKYQINTKLNIQGGLRYDLKYLLIPQQNFFNLFSQKLEKNYRNFSASIGSVLDFNNHMIFRINVANGFRTPNIAELAENGLHADRYEKGNIDLKSQKSIEADASMHIHFHIFMFDFAVFNNHIFNYIYLAPTNDTVMNMIIYTYKQADANIRGGELTTNLALSEKFTLKANYNYAIGRLDNGFIPLFPQNKIRSELLFKQKIKDNKFTFSIEGLYAFSQTNIAQYELPTPAYWLINPNVSYQIDKSKVQWFLGLKVNNLLNNKYIDHLSTVRSLGFYDMGRNIILQLNIRIK